MHSSVRIGLVSFCTLSVAWSMLLPLAQAQNVDTPTCLAQTYNALSHEKRIYRSVLFGQKAAADLPVGSVQYDLEGNTWIKKTDNQWRSLAVGYEGTGWGDMTMDKFNDVPVRRGIMETRKTPTSDLIPELTQAFRAYQCHLNAVCSSALKSQTETGSDVLQVTTDGCIEIDEPLLSECKNNTQFTAGANTCINVVNGMLNQEQQALVLLTSYDAAYRSVLQFTGVFEGFLDDFRFPLLEPIWQTVRAIGGLAHIPCFIGQCDE